MKIKTILFFAIPVLVSGCIPIMSLNPFYNESDIVFEPKLVGTWIEDYNEPNNAWIFSHDGNEPNEAYKLIINIGDDKGTFGACLFKLNNNMFLDICPGDLALEEIDPNNMKNVSLNLIFMLSVHSIIKVDFTEQNLILRLTDDDRFEKLMKEDQDAVAYSEVEGKIILTSHTKELQDFILKYANDEKLFPEKGKLIRKE